MKILLKNMGWINYRGKVDWEEVTVDIAAFTVLISAVWLLYVCS